MANEFRRPPLAVVLDGRRCRPVRRAADLAPGFIIRTRAIGKHGHRHGLGEAAAELRQRKGDDRDNIDDGG